LVIVGVALVAVSGVYSALHIPIDAVCPRSRSFAASRSSASPS
jgi:hypothetical protein